MNAEKESGAQAMKTTPDRIKLGPVQASRLSRMTGLPAQELQGKTIADLSDSLKWKIHPDLFLFRQVCGKVVKTDPATGIDYPVPYATVHIMDTDCSFLGLFPAESPWAWLFPVFCHNEEIGHVKTDACGNFCVWIPAFEIDWIRRWRLERHCLPDLLVKPNLWDILEHLKIIPPEVIPVPFPPGPGPWPGPDPAPYLTRNPDGMRRVEALAGRATALKLQAAAQSSMLNLRQIGLPELLNQPAFQSPLPPPISRSLHELHEQYRKKGAEALTSHLGGAAGRGYKLDLHHYAGPFPRWKCHWDIHTEWVPILDVPDITFRVTQDVNGDGTEETIYAEGFFDVRWNAGSIPPVTLHASQIAVASPLCGQIPAISCQETGAGAGIKGVSLMQLDPPAAGDPYVDASTGFAVRPNRPHADGLLHGSAFSTTDPLATAPFCGTLLLRGCNHVPGASYYRVLYKRNGATEVPFVNCSWPIFRPLSSTPTWVNPVDGNGWYSVLPDPANWLIPYLLLAWPSYQHQPGVYDLRIELADGSKNHLAYSAPVRLNVDNTGPGAAITGLSWRVEGALAWTPLSLQCPVVRRPAGANIEFQVAWQASASHLLYTQLVASGCGSSSAVLNLTSGTASAEHWYNSELDNTVTKTATYRLNFPSGGQPDNQGAYAFYVNAYSRAIDPSHATGYVQDWQYNVLWIGGTLDTAKVAVVNA